MVRHEMNLTIARQPSGAVIRPVALANLGGQLQQADLAAAHEQGFLAGMKQANQTAAKALDEGLDRLDKAREEALAILSTSAVELAVDIARQIVRVEIDAGNYDLERIVRGALSQSGLGRGEAVIHVCPADHERLQEVTFRNGTEVEIDSTLKPGDVHVQAAQGLLVREVSECLSAVREQLLEDLA